MALFWECPLADIQALIVYDTAISKTVYSFPSWGQWSYNNPHLTDGAGSQTQKVYTISICRGRTLTKSTIYDCIWNAIRMSTLVRRSDTCQHLVFCSTISVSCVDLGPLAPLWTSRKVKIPVLGERLENTFQPRFWFHNHGFWICRCYQQQIKKNIHKTSHYWTCIDNFFSSLFLTGSV